MSKLVSKKKCDDTLYGELLTSKHKSFYIIIGYEQNMT